MPKAKQATKTPPRRTLPGEIRSDAVYTLYEFKRRSGMQDWAFRAARRKGLQVLRLGRNGYVHGADWIKFLRDQEALP